MLIARSPPRGADPRLLSKLFRLLASSLVPGGGYLLYQWTPATALALYWFENVIGSVAMAIRISEHRRLNGDRAHRDPQLGLKFTSEDSRGKEKPVKFKSFLSEFVTGMTAFGVAHGAFLVVALAAIVQKPDWAALKQGAIAIALCHAIAVTVDLFTIQNWPFEKLKEQAQSLMGRTILVQFALIGGTWLAIAKDQPDSFFKVFVWLKTASDVAGMVTSLALPKPPVVALDETVERDIKHKKRNR